MTAKHTISAAALIGFATVSSLVVSAPAAGQDNDDPEPVTWQSAGDSYSSGEGVYGNIGDCAQSDNAYGPLTAWLLDNSGFDVTSATFTACTGHLVEDYFTGRKSGDDSLWQWGINQGGPERVDMIAMSFGGNDIGFADVITGCVTGLPNSWETFIGTERSCRVGDDELTSRIDALLDPTRQCNGMRHNGSAGYDCDLNLGARRGSIIDFYYDVVTDRLTDRGRLYVVGYPAVFAPTGEWPLWSALNCMHVPRSEADELGRVASHLNVKLIEAVGRANQALGSARVVYVNRQDLYRNGGHELCGTGEDWLNGISVNRGYGLAYRIETSFHPNQAGHAATAQLLYQTVTSTFPTTPVAPAQPQLVSGTFTAPASTCGFDQLGSTPGAIEVVDGSWAGSDGETIVANDAVTGDIDGDGLLDAAVVVDCNAGGNAVWSDLIVEWGDGGSFTVDEALLGRDVWQSEFVDGYNITSLDGTLDITWVSHAFDAYPACCPQYVFASQHHRSGDTIELTDMTIETTFDPFAQGRLHKLNFDTMTAVFEPWFESGPEWPSFVFRQATEPLTVRLAADFVIERSYEPDVQNPAAFAEFINNRSEPEFVNARIEDGELHAILPYYERGGHGDVDYDYCFSLLPDDWIDIGGCDADL